MALSAPGYEDVAGLYWSSKDNVRSPKDRKKALSVLFLSFLKKFSGPVNIQASERSNPPLNTRIVWKGNVKSRFTFTS